MSLTMKQKQAVTKQLAGSVHAMIASGVCSQAQQMLHHEHAKRNVFL